MVLSGPVKWGVPGLTHVIIGGSEETRIFSIVETKSLTMPLFSMADTKMLQLWIFIMALFYFCVWIKHYIEILNKLYNISIFYDNVV